MANTKNTNLVVEELNETMGDDVMFVDLVPAEGGSKVLKGFGIAALAAAAVGGAIYAYKKFKAKKNMAVVGDDTDEFDTKEFEN